MRERGFSTRSRYCIFSALGTTLRSMSIFQKRRFILSHQASSLVFCTKRYYPDVMFGGVLPFFFFFSFISLIADGPHHYHPACGHKGSSHLSPVHALQFFYRDASSALLQLVNQWLNFTFSRSHAFRYERKKTNPTLVRIELTTSVLADVQLTY